MKNLVICLDGTWNDADRPTPLTNIGRIAASIHPKPTADLEQRVYYDSGVGTAGLLDRVKGGTFGIGLSGNVLEAYRFLSQFYEDGFDILVFGFSRGAFTARSLCGFLSASGLLLPERCDPYHLDFAWNYYRTPPKQRFPADRRKLDAITRANVRVRFLGVFDTVGALGVPRKWLNWIGHHRFAFHDTEVSSVVDHSCHALAIDEKRIEFEPAVWTAPRHRGFRTVEQVWFPGVHSDIGGGYPAHELADVTFDWMTGRARRYCPSLAFEEPPPPVVADGVLHDSLATPIYWRSRRTPMIRTIDRCKVDGATRCCFPVERPHSKPIGEMLHWTALARLGTTAHGPGDAPYAPPNLVAAVANARLGRTPVVGPEGEPVPWAVAETYLARA
ncbi:MAG: DUF2235 domain-containing protein [Alphaproteobacteria bacterium]|nr:DUF2235 domain-containing protein [Alphaproteobacteria bacterium]